MTPPQVSTHVDHHCRVESCIGRRLLAYHVAGCYTPVVANRTEPKTLREWIRYIVVALIALFLVWWMLRSYVL